MNVKKKKLIGRMVQVVLRLPVETDSKVRMVAKKEYRSYSSVLRQAIIEWLENYKKGEKT